MENINNNPLHNRRNKNTKREYAKQLFNILFEKPMSRRMAATELGFIDQTYMVTQLIYAWIEQVRAQEIGLIKCSRSNRMVGVVTTDPALFRENDENQLKLF